MIIYAPPIVWFLVLGGFIFGIAWGLYKMFISNYKTQF